MTKNYVLPILLTCFLISQFVHAEIDSPQKHYAYAVDLMENGAYNTAKIEFVKIIHIYGKNEYQDDARYHLGEIAFKENQLEVALHQWNRLRKEHPQSPYIKDIVQKINLASEHLAKKEKSEIEDMSIKILFDNADFLLQRHSGSTQSSILSIDTSYLPCEVMAGEWYRKIVEKHPNSQYAPEALYKQMLLAYGWSQEGIGNQKPEGYGLMYNLRYGKTAAIAEAGVKSNLSDITTTLKELEEKYPESYWIIPANFLVGQTYWIISEMSKYMEHITYAEDISAKENAIKYFQKLFEITEKNELSLYRQIAQARLNSLN